MYDIGNALVFVLADISFKNLDVWNANAPLLLAPMLGSRALWALLGARQTLLRVLSLKHYNLKVILYLKLPLC